MKLAEKLQTSTNTDTLSEFKSSVRWAVGCPEWDPKAGKFVKKAYCPRTGRILKSNDPEMWTCSYGEALRVKEEWGLDYVCFLLTEDDPYHLTDQDDIGSINNPGVQKTIREQDTYAELSLNGEGVHLYGIATKPDNQRKKDFQVNGVDTESYDRTRLVVFTGKVIHDAPIRNVQEWLEKNIPIKKTQSKNIEPVPVDASDEEIIEKAQKGERFRRLFCEGDVSIYDDDDSQADIGPLRDAGLLDRT